MRSRIVGSPHNSLGRMHESNGSIDCELPAQLIPCPFQSRPELELWNRWAPPSPLATGPAGVPTRSRRSPRTLMPDPLLREARCSRSEVAAQPACDLQYQCLRNTNV